MQMINDWLLSPVHSQFTYGDQSFGQYCFPLIFISFQNYQTIGFENFLFMNNNINAGEPTQVAQTEDANSSINIQHGQPSKALSTNIINEKNQKKEKQINPFIKSRNILPNNVNLILSYLRRINKSGKIVKKIIQKKRRNKTFTVKKYYSYQSYLKNNIQCDINRHELREVSKFCDPSCSIFSLEEQKFYNQVFRIVACNFLQNQGVLSVLSAHRKIKTQRIDHLRSYRFMMMELTNLDDQFERFLTKD